MKKMLIIEEPESCETCPLRSYSNLQLICTPMREGASDVECPLKPISKEELISKILFEVDGGTDDRYISYYDICQRVEQSVNDWFEELEK